MNEFQKKLVEMKHQVPDCTSSRQRLRSVMSDFFPGEKLRINAILNAYDEDIEARLGNSSDQTLTALQFVKVLKDDYGLVDDNAVEAVSAWCFIMGLNEIADALGNINPATNRNGNQENANGNIKPINGRTYTLGLGIYRAGTDFPQGRFLLKIDGEPIEVSYGIGENPNEIGLWNKFWDQIYIDIQDGQFLQLENVMHMEGCSILATKID